jgi:YVTN family beta-propeller protein
MRALLAGAAMAGIAAVAACDGENLFTVPGDGAGGADTRAPTVEISVPRGDSISGTAVGDSVLVSVRLTDRVGVRTVTMSGFSARGDAALGTQVIVPRFAEKTVELKAGVKDTTLVRYLLAAGADSARERAFVVVQAADSAGNVAADTASLSVGGPVVTLAGIQKGSVVSSGGSLAARITAADPKGVNQVRLEVRGSLIRDVIKDLGTPANPVQLDTLVAIPDTAAGPITVRAAARNTLGIVERTAFVELLIADRKPPAAKVLLPRGDSLSAKPLGDSVLVTARVTDNFGVRSVRMRGFAHRGNRDLGTDVVVERFVERAITFPVGVRDTTISRYLRAIPDSTKETAWIQVIAADAAGNQSLDSVALVLGGPDVEILDIVNGQTIQSGLQLTARVRAQDPLGISRVRITVAGAFQAEVNKTITPPRDSVVVDTIIPIPAGITGPIQITAIAWNTLDVAGQDGPLGMGVVGAGAGDTLRPVVGHVAAAVDRMELQDSVFIQVTGSDPGSGVVTAGFTVLAISPTRGATRVRSDSVTFAPPRTGTVTRSFSVPAFNVNPLNLPDTLIFEVHTWMRDADGNCGASIGGGTGVSFPCATLPTGETVAQNRVGQRLTRSVVAGRTVLLPRGGRIMDAVVDTVLRSRTRTCSTAPCRQLYLSNISNNRLEVFDLGTQAFTAEIGVGSEPWGLALSRGGDSLWVANSGGTNLSVVHLGSEQEIDSRRLLTPRANIWDVELRVSESGVRYILHRYPGADAPSFSDRPQFVAVDSFGNLVYATKTTPVGNLGTARKAYVMPGAARPEIKLFVEHAETRPSDDFWAVAHIDSIRSTIDTLSVDSLGVPTIEAVLGFFDHESGFPDRVIKAVARSSSPDAVVQAASELRLAGSDILVYPGARWHLEALAFNDTTFVASSADGGWVMVGEGASRPVGRVLSYRASPGDATALSARGDVEDILRNASEEVRGVGMNHDGTLAVVRGRFYAYFLNPEDLRLQGITEVPLATQGAGAALHPLHANYKSLRNNGTYRPDTHLAFVGSGARTVDIIDTWRFTRIGRIHIRDIITGPLRAVLPFPEDNAGLTCGTIPVSNLAGRRIGEAIQLYRDGNFLQPLAPDGEGTTDDRCVVVKLFATSSAGGVVVIDVRKSDIFREHPWRR